MKLKSRPALVGAFVIGAFVLAIIALLSFGGVHFFAKPLRFVTYFDESVQGLDLGSPVKLRGVRVGRVVDLHVTYNAQKNQSVVGVICELNRDSISDAKGARLDVSNREQLQALADRGLRAQLGVLGLATGQLFVELDFVDPKENPPPTLYEQPPFVVVPALPSTISEFQASLTDILNNLKRVDFEGISKELKGLLADTRKQLANVDLPALTRQWQRTGAQFEALAASPEIKQTFANLNAAIADLRTAIAHVDAQVGPAGQELATTLAQAKTTLESFNRTAEAAQRFIAAQGGLNDDVTRALTQLTAAADAVQRLADFLERNPQALLSGRGRKP